MSEEGVDLVAGERARPAALAARVVRETGSVAPRPARPDGSWLEAAAAVRAHVVEYILDEPNRAVYVVIPLKVLPHAGFR